MPSSLTLSTCTSKAALLVVIATLITAPNALLAADPYAVTGPAGRPELAPGQWFTAWGPGDFGCVATAGQYPFPKQLGECRLEVDGQPVLLSYTSPAQVNGKVPVDAALGVAVFELVRPDESRVRLAEKQFQASAISILRIPYTFAAVQHPDYTLAFTGAPLGGQSTKALRPGDVGTVYITGSSLSGNSIPLEGPAGYGADGKLLLSAGLTITIGQHTAQIVPVDGVEGAAIWSPGGEGYQQVASWFLTVCRPVCPRCG